MSKEPSMEEILSSIKRIIAEESESAPKPAPRATRGRAKAKDSPDAEADATESQDEEAGDEVLELTQAVGAGAEEGLMQDDVIMSDAAAAASRHSLAALSALIVRPDDAAPNTLEGLVREMLKPMLREWLDANLPDIVERTVAREIARLTERQL